jgi:hypothetical protein
MTEFNATTTPAKDRRVSIGFLLAPLIAIPVWKEASVLAVPATYIAMVVVGVPAFQHLARLGRYQWWYALGTGWIAGLLLAVLYLVSVDPFHALLNAPGVFILLQGFGALLGLLFWAIAVFRNVRYPGADRIWILAPLCAIAVFLGTKALLNRFEIRQVYGNVVAQTPGGGVILVLPTGRRIGVKPSWENTLNLPESRPVGAFTRLEWFSNEELFWLNGLCKENDDRVVPCVLDDRYLPPPPRGTQ